MKRHFSRLSFFIVLLAMLPVRAFAAQYLVPVGQVIGLQLYNDTVTVAAYDDVLGGTAKNAGLKIGDTIVKINGAAITCAEDVRAALNSGEKELNLTVSRGGKQRELTLTPTQTEDGPRMGVYLRQGIAGIGTVTWYDPDTGAFGALGHGVCDSGGLLKMTRGSAYDAAVTEVKKGKSGDPGQLKGTARSIEPMAPLLRNTAQGVFGVTAQGWKGEALPVAEYAQIHTGPASIRAQTGSGQAQEYSVEILKIYPQTRTDCRNFLLKVTDPDLLSTTGGIVQGMSGSPILQDGQLIGAVTHVLVNDPTMGYGIYIQNMLDAAA
ncbi:MAG: SpoIVB peptidase S55 domain-containing protein [Eubacteriales bacterium]|nr:SpoIVB peptidase S55 domain-containing protein [Eubacteriales bacterium]